MVLTKTPQKNTIKMNGPTKHHTPHAMKTHLQIIAIATPHGDTQHLFRDDHRPLTQECEERLVKLSSTLFPPGFDSDAMPTLTVCSKAKRSEQAYERLIDSVSFDIASGPEPIEGLFPEKDIRPLYESHLPRRQLAPVWNLPGGQYQLRNHLNLLSEELEPLIQDTKPCSVVVVGHGLTSQLAMLCVAKRLFGGITPEIIWLISQTTLRSGEAIKLNRSVHGNVEFRHHSYDSVLTGRSVLVA